MSFPQLPEIGSPFSPTIHHPWTEADLWLGEADELTQLARMEAAAKNRFDPSSALSGGGSPYSHMPYGSWPEEEKWCDEPNQLAPVEAAAKNRFDSSSALSCAGSPSSRVPPPESRNEDPEMGDMDQDIPGSVPSMASRDEAQVPSSESAPIAQKRKRYPFEQARKSFDPALSELAKILHREQGVYPNHPAILAWKQEHLPDLDLTLKQCVACKGVDRTTYKVRDVGIALCKPCQDSFYYKKCKLNEQTAQPETSSEVVDSENTPPLKSKRTRISPASTRGPYRKLPAEVKAARNTAIEELILIFLYAASLDHLERDVMKWKERQSPSSAPLKEACEVCKIAAVQKTSQVADSIFIDFCNSCYSMFHERKSRKKKAEELYPIRI